MKRDSGTYDGFDQMPIGGRGRTATGTRPAVNTGHRAA